MHGLTWFIIRIRLQPRSVGNKSLIFSLSLPPPSLSHFSQHLQFHKLFGDLLPHIAKVFFYFGVAITATDWVFPLFIAARNQYRTTFTSASHRIVDRSGDDCQDQLLLVLINLVGHELSRSTMAHASLLSCGTLSSLHQSENHLPPHQSMPQEPTPDPR